MRIVARPLHLWFAAFGLLIVVAASGCLDRDSAATASVSPAPTKQTPDALKAKIDDVVDYTLNARLMTTRDQAAWQIVHGIEAYGRDLPLEHDGQVSSALDYLLAGEVLKGWVMRPGDKGVFSLLEAGSKTGQGHPDQWLGYISQCGDVKADDPMTVGGKRYHIRDLMSEAQWQLYNGEEASWTLMGAVSYLPLDAKWTSKDGTKWTFERLVGMEAANKLGTGGCFGTHRMYALAMAVNRYVRETGADPRELKGGWGAAEEKITEALDRVQQFQRPDHSFSTGVFEKSTESPDLGTRIYAAGHTLEFVAVALPSDELSEAWVVAGVNRLCDEMNAARQMEPDCGTLYHAAHSLRLYRDLRFGARRPHLAAN